MKIMQKAWAHYKALCVPEFASKAQVDATKQAFYAGAVSLFADLSSIAALSESDGKQAVNDLKSEFAAFITGVALDGDGDGDEKTTYFGKEAQA